MKLEVNSMLFVFITFLSVPAIVTLIEKQSDVYALYNFAEQKLHNQIKEVKIRAKTIYNNELIMYVNDLKSKIISENK